MDIKYRYNRVRYATEQEAQDAVVAMKNKLDNNPTEWCVVKLLSEEDNGTFSIPTETLTDNEINNPDENSRYSVYSPITGETFIPVDSTELTNKVAVFRSAFFTQNLLHTIYKEDIDDVTIPFTRITPNVDMSEYV